MTTFMMVWKCQMCGHVSETEKVAESAREVLFYAGEGMRVHNTCPSAVGGLGVMIKMGVKKKDGVVP